MPCPHLWKWNDTKSNVSGIMIFSKLRGIYYPKRKSKRKLFGKERVHVMNHVSENNAWDAYWKTENQETAMKWKRKRNWSMRIAQISYESRSKAAPAAPVFCKALRYDPRCRAPPWSANGAVILICPEDANRPLQKRKVDTGHADTHVIALPRQIYLYCSMYTRMQRTAVVRAKPC